MGRIIVANRRGHQVVEWSTTDTEEARATVAEAERILREARAWPCVIAKKVDGVHVLAAARSIPPPRSTRSSLLSPAAEPREKTLGRRAEVRAHGTVAAGG